MKTVSISTDNEKMWQLLINFLEKHTLNFQVQETDKQEIERKNYVWELCQSPLSLNDVKPLSREEIYE